MSVPHVKRVVTLCLGALLGSAALVAGVLVTPAGASTLLSADGFTSLTTQGTVTAHTPYASGQTISITVAPNSTMNNAAMVAAGYPSGADPIKFLECADPGGTKLPTAKTDCDPGTVATISGAGNDGSMSVTGPPGGFQVLALPDPNLGGGPITCGFAPNYCVVGIFADQNDFTKPHLFSAPFVVAPDGGADSGQPAGDGTPPSGTPPTVTGVSPSSGSTLGGTSVNITGTNLSGASLVDFGTTAATSFSVNSASSITAHSPAGSGTVDVTVTTPSGISSTSTADQFSYVLPPTITSASSVTFTTGVAGTFQVTAVGIPTPTYSETGNLPPGVTFSTGGKLAGTPTAAGTFPITITASNGVSPNGTQSFTLTVQGFHISTTSLPNGAISHPYGPVTLQTLGQATGAAVKFKKLIPLPKGLKLKSGVLQGTPSTKVAPGNYPVSVEATEKYKVNKVKFAVTVTASFTLHIT